MSNNSGSHSLLYVTSLGIQMWDFFINGKETYSGLLPFFVPLQELLKRDDVKKIVFILFINKKYRKHGITIPERHRNKIVVYPIYCDESFKSPSFTFIKCPWAVCFGFYLVKKYNIGRIIGDGTIGVIGGIIARIARIPFVSRLYGVAWTQKDLDLSKVKFFLKHPALFLSLKIKSEAIIMTNDGSLGEQFFDKFGNKKNKFFLLFDGVDKDINLKVSDPGISIPEPYFSYVSRYDRFKRPHLAIDAWRYLRDQLGDRTPYLVFVGPVSDKRYYDELLKKVEEDKLTDCVKFFDGMPHSKSMWILKNSIATLILYEGSLFSNVFIESMHLGVPVIASSVSSKSIEFLPEGTYFPTSSDPLDISRMVLEVLNNDEKRNQVASKARKFSEENIPSWDERLKLELKLFIGDSNDG